MEDKGNVWLLWRERLDSGGRATGDSGVLVGVYADIASARDEAGKYRQSDMNGSLIITIEKVVAQ